MADEHLGADVLASSGFGARPAVEAHHGAQRRPAAPELERGASSEAVPDGCDLGAVHAGLRAQRIESRLRAGPPAADVGAHGVHELDRLRQVLGLPAIAVRISRQGDVAQRRQPPRPLDDVIANTVGFRK